MLTGWGVFCICHLACIGLLGDPNEPELGGVQRLFFLCLSSPEAMLSDIREKGREGEREGEEYQLREKHQSVATCMCPEWEPNP